MLVFSRSDQGDVSRIALLYLQVGDFLHIAPGSITIAGIIIQMRQHPNNFDPDIV